MTNLDGEPIEIEAWFRMRALVEEKIKDPKLGAALRHLPSGFLAVNRTWMWSAFLALNVSTWLQSLCGLDTGPAGRAHGKRLRRELIAIPARVLRHRIGSSCASLPSTETASSPTRGRRFTRWRASPGPERRRSNRSPRPGRQQRLARAPVPDEHALASVTPSPKRH